MTATQAPKKDASGLPIDLAPNPHFDEWDPTPHAYFTVPVGRTELGDVVLGGTHQIEGFGRAEQRGKPARRFDLEYVVQAATEYTARLVLPNDHTLEVKRYTPGLPHRWAWVQMKPSTMRDVDGSNERILVTPAGLQPDYGSDAARCGCGVEAGDPPVDENIDGYGGATTVCDACVDSWREDHVVVRHRA